MMRSICLFLLRYIVMPINLNLVVRLCRNVSSDADDCYITFILCVPIGESYELK
jgi:hypothetical protein